MICRACNTKMKSQQTHCPNCGRPAAKGSLAAPTQKVQLSPSTVQDPKALELDEQVTPKRILRAHEQGPDRKAESQEAANREAGEARPAPANSLSPRRVREALAAKPDLLEKGLRLHRDERMLADGCLTTDVGDIDLLAVDDAGALVVVLIARSDKGGELVSEILQRIGWVRKHIAESEQEVRGLVLLQSSPEDLGYAAAAVANSVSFKTYRMSIVLEDIDI